ncbi:MAG: cobalt-precorrin-6A reductase [Sebaldella sp.]|nr:cobalt-precorrin-6A reductase [Sebaldella sp.]
MIWIISGTKDSRDIVERILDFKNEKILVSTATEYGGKLFRNMNNNLIEIIDQKLDIEEMKKIIIEKNINLIIDASHPYAVNVSSNAIIVSKDLNVKYFRFERKMLSYTGAERFDSLKEMVSYLVNKYENKNILSTLGSNNLGDIKEISEKNSLYIRILPTTDSIQKAEKLGYLPSKIIAIQGPVSKSLNKAMLKSYNIDFLITKESGETGGEIEKVEACKELGVKILVLKRPKIEYLNCFNDIEELMGKIFGN